ATPTLHPGGTMSSSMTFFGAALAAFSPFVLGPASPTALAPESPEKAHFCSSASVYCGQEGEGEDPQGVCTRIVIYCQGKPTVEIHDGEDDPEEGCTEETATLSAELEEEAKALDQAQREL